MFLRRIGNVVRVSALLLTFLAIASSLENPSSMVPAVTKTASSSTSTSDSPSTTAATNTKPKKQQTNKSAKKPTTNISKATIKTAPASSQASASLRRIKKEYKDAVQMGIAYDWVKQKPVVTSKSSSRNEHHNIMCLGPLATNLRHWHFSFRGCGLYESGIYHGRILLPKDYPTTPPRVQLWTPSGRFVPYADICLSASAYHPESWTPRWTVVSLVQALRLHMLTNPQEIGGKTSSVEDTLENARKSLVWKLTWRAGKTQITVDHALILQQGVFTMEEDANQEERVYESGERTVVDSDIQESKDVDVSETTDKQIDSSEGHEILETHSIENTEEEDSTAEQSSQVTGSRESGTAKKKRKKRKSSSTKQQSAVSTTKVRAAKSAVRGKKARQKLSILLSISKIFASPTRIAISSLLLFVWILCIP